MAPRGEIRYTLDGSEPRNGNTYDGPIEIEDTEVLLRAFATAEGIETKEDFSFPARGRKGVQINDTQPAKLVSRTGYKLDSRATSFKGLKQARDKGVTFEEVTLVVGQGSAVASITVGEVPVDAAFLNQLLTTVSEKFDPTAPVTMTFKKASFTSGHDLNAFCEELGLEITQENVQQ